MHTVESSIRVKEQESGLRLDRLLSLRYPDFSRTHWQHLIRDGVVLLENKVVSVSKRISFGQIITYSYLQKEEPQVSHDYKIIHEDQDFLVVDKPANLPVHPSGVYRTKTLLTFLEQQFAKEDLRLVNRLDRETSGLLLVGRNKSSTVALQKQFRSAKVHKEYLVVVEGEFPKTLQADGYIYKDPDSLVWKKMNFVINKEDAKSKAVLSCSTYFESLFFEEGMSLVKAVLASGRTHQIRASLCSLGFPVTGDKIYGSDESFFIKFINDQLTDADKKKLRIQRCSLHSYRTVFFHPVSGERLEFTSTLPDILSSLWTKTSRQKILSYLH